MTTYRNAVKSSEDPTTEEVARIRYLRAVILRCSLRYYYPGEDPGEPPSDYLFDSLEHELEVLCIRFPRYARSSTLLKGDRGAMRFMEWLLANPDKKLAPFYPDEIIPNEDFTNNYCG
jgi:hypothetical protein